MVTIRNFSITDFDAVSEIYRQGIAMGNATFQTRTPDWEAWNQSRLENCRLVAMENNELIGWATLAAASGLCVFAGVAEVSIYIANKAQGKGVGSVLLAALIDCSEQHGLWTLQAGIFPENTASLALHKKHGFRVLGVREKLGEMHGVWRDVVFLERRSRITGC